VASSLVAPPRHAHQRVGESTHGVLDRFLSALDLLEHLDQAGVAELLAVLQSLLGDAVGEEEHPATGLKGLLTDRRGRAAYADGQARGASQGAQDLSRAYQQGDADGRR